MSLSLLSRYLYKCKFDFTFIIVVLLVYYCLPFFMLICVVIVSSTIACKQVCLLHCFGFVGFIYNFNIKRYESKTSNIIMLSDSVSVFRCTYIGIQSSRANTQPFNKYFCVRTQIIFISGFAYMLT